MHSGSDYDDDMDEDLDTFHNPFEEASRRTAEDDQRGRACEIRTYERRYNARGECLTLEAGKRSKKSHKANDRDYNAAIMLVKVYDKDSCLMYTDTRIQSPYLKTAMREVLKEYPGLNLSAPHIVIRDKPKCFFHYRNEFVAYGAGLEDAVAVEHLTFAMDYMYQVLQTETVSWYLWAEPVVIGQEPGLEFEHLWMAFRPGCLVYRNIDGTDALFRFEKMEVKEGRALNEDKAWVLTCTEMISDDTSFGRQEVAVRIREYNFYKPFTELPIFPLEYHPGHQGLYAAAVERGRAYVSLGGAQYRNYSGAAALLSPFREQTVHGEEDYHPLRKTTVNSRVVLDRQGFDHAHPSQSQSCDYKYKRMEVNENLKTRISDDEYAVCTSSIPGFSLQEKRWGFFLVDNITEIEFSDDAFDKLILPSGQKELILSLVQAHSSDGVVFDDLIRGKGKGMIFLLHGVAGVGKTITAESVAERTRQPLYMVGSGDLGVDVNTMEERLSKILRLATSWNAIVLMDEADVFLEKRTSTNLKRNGLVSIFLRVLEYYEGILFLTTNRVKQFDKAFKSRIHMAIQFHRLDAAARRELWETFINRAVDGPSPRWLDDECLEVLSSHPLNGREIKNVVRMSIALATGTGVDLDRKHLDASIRSMNAFDAVMTGDSDDGDSEDETHNYARHGVPRKRFRAT